MNSARRVQIPEGREAETHSEDVIFVKVAREPNRFESVFCYQTAFNVSIHANNRLWGQIKIGQCAKIDNGPSTDRERTVDEPMTER